MFFSGEFGMGKIFILELGMYVVVDCVFVMIVSRKFDCCV